MTSVLVVNAGSSSLKLRVLDAADTVTASADLSPWDGSPDDPGLRDFLGGLTGIGAAGHRVVHGGHRFTAATPIDDEVVAGIGALTDLAPLHQPRALAGIEATRSALPGVPAVACSTPRSTPDCPRPPLATRCRPRGRGASACGGSASTGCRTPTLRAAPRT